MSVESFKKKSPEGYTHSLFIETKGRCYKLYSNDYNNKELFLYYLKQVLQEKEKFEKNYLESRIRSNSDATATATCLSSKDSMAAMSQHSKIKRGFTDGDSIKEQLH